MYNGADGKRVMRIYMNMLLLSDEHVKVEGNDTATSRNGLAPVLELQRCQSTRFTLVYRAPAACRTLKHDCPHICLAFQAPDPNPSLADCIASSL